MSLLSQDAKIQAIGQLKTLYAVDALLEKKWDGLAYLYLQELIILKEDNLVPDFDAEDRENIMLVINNL